MSCDADGALALVPKHEMRGHEGLSVDQARFGEGKFRIRTKQGTLLCAEKPSKAKAEEETAGGRGISARRGARRGRLAMFLSERPQISLHHTGTRELRKGPPPPAAALWYLLSNRKLVHRSTRMVAVL